MFLRSEAASAAPEGVATLEQMWELTRRWYADRLDPDFRRRSPQEYQRMFDEVGLTSDFWALA